jgi:hypothetical protein
MCFSSFKGTATVYRRKITAKTMARTPDPTTLTRTAPLVDAVAEGRALASVEVITTAESVVVIATEADGREEDEVGDPPAVMVSLPTSIPWESQPWL